ncbi:MAG: hypothetical protein EOL87_09940 [Spartobacteria bacterium]|nr:hypothetical protein [Spartobacteria bacterium]
MMKKRIKVILLVWPIVLLLGVAGYFSYQRHQMDMKLMDANGLVWKSADALLVAQINQREEGELLHIQIEIINAGKERIYEKTEMIDRDMFGGRRNEAIVYVCFQLLCSSLAHQGTHTAV